MLSKTFFRGSAVCVFIGALILNLGYILRCNIGKDFIDEFATTQGFISSILVATGSLIFLCGLPAFFASQNLYRTKSGFVVSGLNLISMAAFHLGTVSLYFVLPVLATHNSATRALIYVDEPPFPRFALFWAISLLVQIISLIWLGLKLRKQTSAPGILPFLFICGGFVFLLAPFVYFPLVKLANTLVMFGFMIGAQKMFYAGKQTTTVETAVALS